MATDPRLTSLLRETLGALTALKVDLRCEDDAPDGALVLSARVSRRACDDIDGIMEKLRAALGLASNDGG